MDLEKIQAYLAKSKSEQEQDQKKRDLHGGEQRRMAFPPLLKDDLHVIRILPPIEGEALPAKLIYKHKNLVTEGEKDDKALTCMRTYDMDCPICKVVESHEARIDCKDWLPDIRAYFNALIIQGKDMKDNTPDPELPYMYGAKRGLLDWICEKMLNPAFGDVTDENNGVYIEVRRKRDYGPFEYGVHGLKTFPVHSDPVKSEEILNARYDFKKIWKAPDDAYMARLVKAADLLNKKLTTQVELLSSENNSSGGVLPDLPSSPKS